MNNIRRLIVVPILLSLCAAASAADPTDSLSTQLQDISRLTIQNVSLTATTEAPPAADQTSKRRYGIVQSFDLSMQSLAQDHRSDRTDKIARGFRELGDPFFLYKPLGALFIYGEFANNDRAVKTAGLCTESILLGGGATCAVKYLVKRNRPMSASNGGPHADPYSFPSGHTTVAFAWATVVASEYGGAAKPLAYTAATLTGWSRINDNVHWTSDVLFGALVGYTAGRFVVRHSEGSDSGSGSFRTVCPVALRFAF